MTYEYYFTTGTPRETSKEMNVVHDTSFFNQLGCLLDRGFIKCKRDPVC